MFVLYNKQSLKTDKAGITIPILKMEVVIY